MYHDLGDLQIALFGVNAAINPMESCNTERHTARGSVVDTSLFVSSSLSSVALESKENGVSMRPHLLQFVVLLYLISGAGKRHEHDIVTTINASQFIAVGVIVLFVFKAVTEDITIYSAVSKRASAARTSSSMTPEMMERGNTTGSSDNEPMTDSSLVYAANPLMNDKTSTHNDRWRKFVSIPTVFIVAVLVFIAIIAISITLLSYNAQNNMVEDLTSQIQQEISKSYLSQVNDAFEEYKEWGEEIAAFVGYYIPPSTTPLALNESAYRQYPHIFQYLISSMTHRDIGSGFNIGFSNGKSFGGGYELFGVDIYDTVVINDTNYIWVSILPPSLNFSTIDYPDPHPFYRFSLGPDLTVQDCPTDSSTRYWSPLQPTPVNATSIEIAVIRGVRICYNKMLSYTINVTVKFTRFAKLLQQMVSQAQGRAFIVEKNGALVASTTGSKPFAFTSTGAIVRYFASNCTDDWIREAWRLYIDNPTASQTTHTIDGVDYFLLPSSFDSGDGISWITLHLVESEPYIGTIRVYNRRTGIIVGVVCAFAVVLAVLASFWITRPFTYLTKQLQKAARMQYTEDHISAPVLFEARRLHQAFETMKDAMMSFQRYIPEALVKTRMDYKDLKHLVEIGSGAYGIVFRAEWNDEIVAVKQMKMDRMGETQMSDFLSEVSILQRLPPHRNVVLFRAATFPPQPLSMITEFCGGGSLYAYLRNHPGMLPNEKLRLVTEIARGMRHLHQQKVVHRDLALRNILLSDQLEAKVSDFGLSRVNSNGDGSTTKSDVGPLKWMSPEAVTESRYSTKSDVFSFGVVVWEIFEEQDPFPEVTAVEAAFQVVNGQRLEFTNCPYPWLIRLVQSCWEKEPKNRPSFKYVLQAMINEAIPEDKEVEDDEEVQIPLVTVTVSPTQRRKRMSSTKPRIVIGFDGGATKTNVVAIDVTTAQVLAHWKGPCTNFNSVGPAAVKETIREGIVNVTRDAGSDESHVLGVGLGISGIDRPEDQELVKTWIHEMLPSHSDIAIGIYNDAIAALASGTDGILENGVVLISGTGVIAWGFDKDRKDLRAAGWGPLLGDEGAGYQIGYHVLTASVECADGRGPETTLLPAVLEQLKLKKPEDLIPWAYSSDRIQWAKFADLAPLAVIHMNKGDAVATKIVEKTVHHLLNAVSTVIRRLNLDKEEQFNVVLSGGNLTHDGSVYAKRITEGLRGSFGEKVKVTFPKIGPEVALAILLTKQNQLQ
ncbi:hypothetical protein PROFUN_03778 [Planoprotostelium fungivorum]|uniref:N-acetyl-D-glucosamine kinase n=1 Tax=Planoprotostelium fungivorum TaxID=1890364 RepID=A0A2P6NDQ3_9EUKA|nr:hypothetical protein PROFUN_03778 [Planoprotostelium fungivorum]